MLSLSLAAAAAQAPIHFEDLGLRSYLFAFETPLGLFQLRWYSLAYLAGIIGAYVVVLKMIKAPGAPLAQRHADDLFFYCTLGVILGGRLGYATFYTGGDTGLPSLWAHPSELVKLWTGGMSFHGGLVGVLVAIAWVCWKNGLSFLRVADYVAVPVPLGMLFGRLANFVNGELWGRVAGPDVPWAIVFPGAGPLPRHPSQLYEALLEGLLLLVVMLVLFWKTKARWRPGLLVGTFAFGIALGRFVVEFFREPDAQLQTFAQQTGLSMGQWLTLPLMAVGLFFVVRALMRPALGAAPAVPVATDPA
ncbi:phosphatidylglycerol:prolipoprotein diacylglycerol transferase [Novosphingobium kunmingense]|uniref:Phosphatidylglycerol--prolipoprotein diacylglyceryl transferase n=1 Tax=Novosphingobium kunmingense TaxID=1211806 RepID=A0A2N0HJU9_9SPHN|nr:prolipoprotein diacylglyceryl transferase [Novosphingobium kunmingense]PKB19226.1 phosphatidylglycerol:prolipoprotein diacylglycerol transferase [Novosphingobium kunmingense]